MDMIPVKVVPRLQKQRDVTSPVSKVVGILNGADRSVILRNYFSNVLSEQARFLLSKVNPSQTHNNLYAWGQVSNGRAADVWECCKTYIYVCVCVVAIPFQHMATNCERVTFVLSFLPKSFLQTYVTGFGNLTVLCGARKQGYFCVPKDLITELPAGTAIIVAF